MNSLVSVIIPIFNMEKFLSKCINSVKSQTYDNIEIIIINDGSTDNSGAICKEIAESNSNVVLINQENQGVSVARNVGIKAAKGEFVTFLDADDTLQPKAIEVLVEAAEKCDSDMTMGRISKKEVIPVGVFEGKEFLIKALEDNPIAYYSCRILYKRDFVKDVEFLAGYGCGEDSYFVFECALKKPKVVTVEEHVYNYFVNPNSATHSSFTSKRYNDVCDLLSKKEAEISQNYPELLYLFYHLKVKIQMMLLTNFSVVKGARFKNEEKETLARFSEVKGYFQPQLPYSNASYYKILSKNLYYPYKVFMKIRKAAACILKR